MRALIVRDPWVGMILDGRKTWEIRGRTCNIRGRIGLIRAGSGQVVGTVRVVGSLGPLGREELLANVDKHCVPVHQAAASRYKTPYAWVLDQPRRFTRPVRYDHPAGAQMWVTILDIAGNHD